MPECDYCGKDFGNAGALASHQNSCDEKPEPQTAEPVEQTDPDPEPRQAQPRQPQQAQPQQGQGQNLPAQQQPQHAQEAALPEQMSDQDVLSTGMQMGQLLAGAKSGDPSKQAQAKGSLLKAAAGAMASVGERVAQEGQERHERAKQNAGRELQASNQYPECAECGGQITQVPDEEPFPCPHCRAMLEFQ